MFQGPKRYIQYVKCTCSMETIQKNGRFTRFSSKFHSNIQRTEKGERVGIENIFLRQK